MSTILEVLDGPAPPPLEIGAVAPAFEGLLGVDGAQYALSSFSAARLLVLIFSSNRCPTVKAYEGRMRAFQDGYRELGLQLVAINSNSPFLYPDESYPAMIERAAEGQYNFPYLADPDQVVGRAYGPQRTFHTYLFDSERTLRYEGRFDDSRLPERVTSNDLQNAVEDLLAGRPVREPKSRPFGCSLDFV